MPSARKWKFRVEHILEAIEKIQRYTDGMSEETFAASGITVDAVIRNFQVIGEAARRVPRPIQAQYSQIPWSAMQGMRHILIHDYDVVRVQIVWKTIRDDLPLLVEPLKAMLGESPE